MRRDGTLFHCTGSAHKRKGKVVRQYFGRGPKAEEAAAEDTERRRKREVEAEARRAEKKRWDEINDLVARFVKVADFLVAATLLAAGFHQHDRGAWRLRTHERKP